MTRHGWRFGALFFSVSQVVLACGQPTATSGKPAAITSLPRALNAAEQAIALSTSGLGLALLKNVNQTMGDSNVFLSPLSASMALGMTLNGANSSTYEEMRTALFLPDRPLSELNASYQALIALLRALDKTVDFRIANSIWYKQSFGPAIEPTFVNDTKNYFGAQVQGLDFASSAAKDAINSWVNTSTNGKISKIVDQIPPQMVMYLINAVYFKGAWRQGFDPKRTGDGPFFTHTGAQVTAKLMGRKGGYRAALVDASITVLEIPYGGDAYAMTVILPPQTTPINTFLLSLNIPEFRRLLASPVEESTYDLIFPKFTLTWEKKLNDNLKSLGMQQAFVPGGADFTRLSKGSGRDLYVDEVKQKTFVDVNEQGTEAAAVTSVGVGVTSAPPAYRVDRPFLFVIRERLSGTVLFMGKVVRP